VVSISWRFSTMVLSAGPEESLVAEASQDVVDFLLGSAIMRHPCLSVDVEAELFS